MTPTIPSPQLPFDWGEDPAAEGAEVFLLSPSNNEAFGLINAWPTWPALALVGPSGSGKTHLVHIWANHAAATICELEDLPKALGSPAFGASPVAIEFKHEMKDWSQPIEEALFHLINRINAAGSHLLLTGKTPPAHWPVRLPDLRTRLAAIPVTRLTAPDDSLLHALLLKLFTDRQLKVSHDVVEYLVKRLERSFAAARQAVAALDAASLAEHEEITPRLAARVLKLTGPEEAGNVADEDPPHA
ncbi:MAG: chromosomal replication initiator DnaA [Alphaproteobacteria bacterium]|nr:chromosomal replication initiator DnaA [Alphaproteobacteria bacterium]